MDPDSNALEQFILDGATSYIELYHSTVKEVITVLEGFPGLPAMEGDMSQDLAEIREVLFDQRELAAEAKELLERIIGSIDGFGTMADVLLGGDDQ